MNFWRFCKKMLSLPSENGLSLCLALPAPLGEAFTFCKMEKTVKLSPPVAVAGAVPAAFLGVPGREHIHL